MLKDGQKAQSVLVPEGTSTTKFSTRAMNKSLDWGKSEVLDLNSLKDLTFANFVKTDLSYFSAKVIGNRKRVMSSTEYVVEIKVSNIPPFYRYKSYSQFRAFYKALKLRFINVKWPEFPSKIQLIKKLETRMNGFNNILKKLFEALHTGIEYRKSLLSIFFAFFLEHAGENTTATNTRKSSNKNSDDNSDNEEAHEDNIKMSILEFEKQQGGATDYELIMDDDMFSVADRSSILSREGIRKGSRNDLKEYNNSFYIDKNQVHRKLSCDDHTNSDLLVFSPSQAMMNKGNPPGTSSPSSNNENMTKSGQITEGGTATSPGLLKIQEKHKVSVSIEETKEENKNPKDKRARKISKDEASISGLIYMKLSSSANWNKYFARIFNSTIYLYSSIMVISDSG